MNNNSLANSIQYCNNYRQGQSQIFNLPDSIIATPVGPPQKITNTFNYLENAGYTKKFKLESEPIDMIYKPLRGKIYYVFCILVKNDSYNNSILLEKTLSRIKYILSYMKEILIEPENILICIFFNEIKNNDLFNEKDINTLEDKNEYILKIKKYIVDNKNINVHCFTKLGYFSDVEILKCFYCKIIKQLKPENNIIFTSTISAGIYLYSNAFYNLIQLSYYSKNTHNIVVPQIEEDKNDNIIFKIKKYERIHYNIYNLNFYDMTASVPLSSLFNIMTIDNKLFNCLNNYYKKININMSIDFHDYNLSLFLYQNNINILYYNRKSLGIIFYLDYYQNQVSDYRDTWIKRYSGYYGNIFRIIGTFFSCNNFNFFKKILMIFQIFGLLAEFVFPSLSNMVIFTVFYEAFGMYDMRPATFFALLYLSILICSGACSLITNKSKKTQIAFIIFYFFMELYYIFILICSIIAIYNVKKNKNNDSYKFNTKAITCIIILTFIPAALPMIFKASTFLSNFFPMILYLLLGASPSTSIFHMAKILNACEACGGKNIKERKGITLLIYLLFNLLFGSLVFFNYNRTRRIRIIMIFGIIYLIYNFFKVFGIIINLLINSNKLNIPSNCSEEIKKELSKNNNLKNSSFNPYKENNKDFSKNGDQSSNYDNQKQTFYKSDGFEISINQESKLS